ncbi:MAG: hypothetical protein ABEN55_03955 [Bradymonadaceae bacterium]
MDKLEETIRNQDLHASKRCEAYEWWLFESNDERLERAYQQDPLVNALIDHYFEVIERAMREGVFLDDSQPHLDLGHQDRIDDTIERDVEPFRQALKERTWDHAPLFMVNSKSLEKLNLFEDNG